MAENVSRLATNIPEGVSGPGYDDAAESIPLVIVGGEGVWIESLYSALRQRSFRPNLVAGFAGGTVEDAVNDGGIHIFADNAGANREAHIRAIGRLAEYGQKTIFLSEGVHARKVLSIGATAVVSMKARMDDLEHTIRCVHAGSRLANRAGLVALRAGEPPERPGGPFEHLTPREYQCLTLLHDGRSTAEIMEEMGVEHATARTHIQNLLTKLGVHSRVAAAAWYHSKI